MTRLYTEGMSLDPEVTDAERQDAVETIASGEPRDLMRKTWWVHWAVADAPECPVDFLSWLLDHSQIDAVRRRAWSALPEEYRELRRLNDMAPPLRSG